MTVIHGVDSSKIVLPLLLSASGEVIVSSSTFPVDNITGVAESGSDAALAGGNVAVTAAAIPASKIYVLTRYTIRYVGTVAGVYVRPRVNVSGTQIYFAEHRNLTSNVYVAENVQLTLEAGWVVSFFIGGSTLNDDFFYSLFYTRIK